MYLGIILKLFVGASLVIDISFTLEDLQLNTDLWNSLCRVTPNITIHHTTTVGLNIVQACEEIKKSTTKPKLNFVLVQSLDKRTKMHHQEGHLA